MKAKSIGHRLLVLLPLAVSSACISLPRPADRPSSAVFALRTSASSEMSAEISSLPPTRTRDTIVVSRPELPPGYDTDRIAVYFEREQRLDYYADAMWPARLDDLVQDFVIERARQQLPGIIIGKPELGAAANYRIALKVTEFTPTYPTYEESPKTRPRLDVAITVTVIALPRDEVRTQFTVRRTTPASENRLSTITSELATLLQTLTDEALRQAAPTLLASAAS